MSSLQKALVEEKKSSLQSALAKEMMQNGGGKRNRYKKSPPTVTTAYESDSDDDDSSSSSDESDSDDEVEQRDGKEPMMMNGADMMKIRQEAIKLVNTPSSGPNAEAKRRSGASKPFVSPYQQSSSGDRPSSLHSYQSSSYQSSSYQSAPRSMHDPLSHPQAKTAEKLTMTEMVVSCVSEVCKSSSSELISKVLSSGYRSVNNYENPPVNGSWGEIDTSQHGYGNNNRSPSTNVRVGNMPSRYQD